MDLVFTELFALRDQTPQSNMVQELIASHYAIVRKFWGTSNSKDKQAEAYAGLGSLYVSDERYTLISLKDKRARNLHDSCRNQCLTSQKRS